MMSSHSLIGLVQSFFTKSDVEAEDPMMAMKLELHAWKWYDCKKNEISFHFSDCSYVARLNSWLLRMGGMGGAPMMPGGGPDPAKVYKTEQDGIWGHMRKHWHAQRVYIHTESCLLVV